MSNANCHVHRRAFKEIITRYHIEAGSITFNEDFKRPHPKVSRLEGEYQVQMHMVNLYLSFYPSIFLSFILRLPYISSPNKNCIQIVRLGQYMYIVVFSFTATLQRIRTYIRRYTFPIQCFIMGIPIPMHIIFPAKTLVAPTVSIKPIACHRVCDSISQIEGLAQNYCNCILLIFQEKQKTFLF